MTLLDRMAVLPLALVFLGTGCWDRTRIDVPLAEVDGSGVSGTAHLQNAFCKSNCALVTVELAGATLREVSVALHAGRCAALGPTVDAFSFPCTDPAECHHQLSTSDVRTLEGDHAIAAWRFDPVEQVSTLVACGDV